MTRLSLIFSFLFISIQNITFISSYSLFEIRKDRKHLQSELEEFIHYRGDILNDAWIYEAKQHDDEALCKRLYEKVLEGTNITWPPPHQPPVELKDFYTMGGRAKLNDMYFAERQNGGEGYNWNKSVIESYREKPNTCGGYTNDACDHMIRKYEKHAIEGKHVVVIGSQSPWAEAALFNTYAAHVTTIEYMKITSDYPDFSYYHPSEIARAYLDGKWELADSAFSYSSVEHDGLGRYGDPLNPYADLESVARARCLLKPGGHLFLGFPVSADEVVWNAHRLYGRYRLFLMLLGWKIIDLYPQNCVVEHGKVEPNHWQCQPVLLLVKTATSLTSLEKI